MRLSELKKNLPVEMYEECKRKLRERSRHDPASDSVAHVERHPRNERMEKKTVARFTTPVFIRIHSIRRRLADADGISAKAAIDGLRHCGILQDDTAAAISEIGYSQGHGESEETIITIFTTHPKEASWTNEDWLFMK